MASLYKLNYYFFMHKFKSNVFMARNIVRSAVKYGFYYMRKKILFTITGKLNVQTLLLRSPPFKSILFAALAGSGYWVLG